MLVVVVMLVFINIGLVGLLDGCEVFYLFYNFLGLY